MSDIIAHEHGDSGNYEVIAYQKTVTGEVETIYWCKVCGAYSVRQKYTDAEGEHNLVSNWITPQIFKIILENRKKAQATK